MATATRAPAKRRGKQIVCPDDLRRISRDLNENAVIERGPVVREIVLTALSGTNLHLLGVPGVAKSLGLREFGKRILGANYFEIPFNEEIGTDEFYGPPDIPRLTNEGVLVRNPEYHAPWAHIIFGDEEFRSNGVMQNALLPIKNVGERHVKLNGHLTRAPCLFYVSASNTMPDPDNVLAHALVSRITTMMHVERLSGDGFEQMLEMVERNRLGVRDGSTQLQTVTLAQLVAAQADVSAVTQTPAFRRAARELRESVFVAGLDVDDRRWVDLEAKCRANAWLSGRDRLVVDDLAVTENGLWRYPDERNAAHEAVKPFFGRFDRAAADMRDEVDEAIKAWREQKPGIEALPPNSNAPADLDRLKQVIATGRRLWATAQRVQKVIGEADSEQQDASALHDLSGEIETVRSWYSANGLPDKIGATT